MSSLAPSSPLYSPLVFHLLPPRAPFFPPLCFIPCPLEPPSFPPCVSSLALHSPLCFIPCPLEPPSFPSSLLHSSLVFHPLTPQAPFIPPCVISCPLEPPSFPPCVSSLAPSSPLLSPLMFHPLPPRAPFIPPLCFIPCPSLPLVFHPLPPRAPFIPLEPPSFLPCVSSLAPSSPLPAHAFIVSFRPSNPVMLRRHSTPFTEPRHDSQLPNLPSRLLAQPGKPRPTPTGWWPRGSFCRWPSKRCHRRRGPAFERSRTCPAHAPRQAKRSSEGRRNPRVDGS